MIRILLVDDHPVVRHGIRSILTDRLKGSVVGEASDAEEALAQVSASQWDVVVADISLPGMSGIDLIKQLHRVKPGLPTLAVSMHPAAQFARRALGAGAIGYLTKDSSPEEFVKAIEDARPRTPLPGPRRRRCPAQLDDEVDRDPARLAFRPRISGSAAPRIRTNRLRHRAGSRVERQDSEHVSHACSREARHAHERRADALRDRERFTRFVSGVQVRPLIAGAGTA